MNLARMLRHLLTPPWLALRAFSPALRAEIASAVAASEARHRGEIRIAVEGPLPWPALWRDEAPRARAIELFGELRVWDTEENSGVLIYIQCVDRRVEILADRGIAAKVPQAEWDTICRGMETAFLSGDYRQGMLAAVAETTRRLIAHFPAGASADNPNELPDSPVVL